MEIINGIFKYRGYRVRINKQMNDYNVVIERNDGIITGVIADRNIDIENPIIWAKSYIDKVIEEDKTKNNAITELTKLIESIKENKIIVKEIEYKHGEEQFLLGDYNKMSSVKIEPDKIIITLDE